MKKMYNFHKFVRAADHGQNCPNPDDSWSRTSFTGQ